MYVFSFQTHVSKKSTSLELTSITSDFDSEPPATTNMLPDHRSPSPTIQPLGVIVGRPATAENTLQLEDMESDVR